MKRKISTSLGEALAYIQDGVDQLVSFGFKELKKSGNTKVKKTDHPVKKTLLHTTGFLGELGSSFYEKYDEIKQKRMKKK